MTARNRKRLRARSEAGTTTRRRGDGTSSKNGIRQRSKQKRKDLLPPFGCMGINAICEFGLTDQEVLEAMQDAAKLQRRVLLETLRRAEKEGELAPDADITGLAEFIEVTLAGLRIAAKGGMGRTALKRIVEIATSVF